MFFHGFPGSNRLGDLIVCDWVGQKRMLSVGNEEKAYESESIFRKCEAVEGQSP